jgi:hypothetical protein
MMGLEPTTFCMATRLLRWRLKLFGLVEAKLFA